MYVPVMCLINSEIMLYCFSNRKTNKQQTSIYSRWMSLQVGARLKCDPLIKDMAAVCLCGCVESLLFSSCSSLCKTSFDAAVWPLFRGHRRLMVQNNVECLIQAAAAVALGFCDVLLC